MDKRMKRLGAKTFRKPLVAFFSIAFAAMSVTFAVPLQAQDPRAYEGVGSCASSQCHGSLSPRKMANVLQNEYSTWKKHDPHAKAWQTLLSADSKRIAHHLGVN